MLNKKLNFILAFFCAALLICSCASDTGNKNTSKKNGQKKIAVLMVNHGSRSETWRNALLQLEQNVRDSIMANGAVADVKTAFMEYTEPSIATRLRQMDSAGITDVIMVPVFLTVSPHSFDDIPTIIGQKEDAQSLEVLKIDKIERYKPKANVHITPLLDFTDILQKNILRRVEALSVKPETEGLALIAYGDETYRKEWDALLDKVGDYIKTNKGISAHSHGWCGHIAHYNPDSTTVTINRVLKQKEKAIVIPVLVAHDEMFQIKIIGDGIAKIDSNKERIIYKPDAILPDENVENWLKNVTREFVEKISLAE